MESHAPATVELIEAINRHLALRCMTQEDFRQMLNRFLPARRQVKGDHSGAVQLSRWLNTSSTKWAEPRAEIVLAMQKVHEELQKTS